uniref:Puratrophin-1 n=1 Tax=Magallana gigas TaxID=29159 RepID=K1R8V1_MAGGI
MGRVSKDEDWCQCGNHKLWPVCYGENIVIHLNKLSEQSLNIGDFYVYVSVLNSCEPCLNVCYNTPSGVKEQVLCDKEIQAFFAMEIMSRRTSLCSDEELGRMLQRCLVLFEGSVQHLKWDETTQGCQDCQRNRMIKDLLKNQSGQWNGSRPNYLCLTADFEINEVEESEIQQVQSELTAIKGTEVDKESQNPGSSVDKYLDISDNRDCTESNLSSPTEYHSARNSEHFPFTDSEASDIESEDNVLSHEIIETSDGQPRNQLSTESETSGDCHENCLMCQHEMYDLLNPDDLSNTGSEVSDFDSDFDFDLTAGDNATFRNTKASGSSDSDPTIENISSQSVSESDMTPNKPDSSNVLCTEDKPAGKFIMGGNPSSEDTSGSNCIFSEKAARGDECCNRNTVVTDQSQGNTRSTNQAMHAVISSGTGSDADGSSFNSQPQLMGVGDGCEGMMPCNSMTDGDSRGDDGEVEEKKRSPSHQKDEMLTVETPGIQSTFNKDNFDESQPNCHIMEVNCDVHSGNALLAERPVSAVFTELGQDRNVDQDRVVSTQSDQEREREGLMGPIQSPSTTENGHLSNALVDKENMDEYPSIIRDIIKNHHRFVDILSKYEQICSVKLDLVSVVEKHQPVKEDMQGSDTEGMSTKNSDRSGATQGPGPGGGQRPLSPRSPGFHKHRNLDAPKTVMDVDYKLLNSGIAVLPGSRDSEERPVVFIFTNSSLWQNQQVPSTELARLLMYYRSIPRDEVRLHGFTVVAVIQGATTSIINTLLESLYLFEGNCPGGIAVLHFLADTYTQPLLQMSPVFDSQTPFKLDVLLAPELLQEFIPLNQLPLDLDGHYMYNHEEWIRFHVELDPFISKIRGVAKYLMVTMQELSEPHIMPVTAQEARQLIEHHEQSMKAAFNDARLISLQNEGESIINCLRRLDAHMGHSEDYRDLMESVNKLYDNLNSTMVKLVHIADSRLSKLEHCQQLREFEEECTKIIAWTERTGEEYLQRHTQLGDNLKSIRVQQKEFEKFYFSAMTHIEKGNDLLDEASMLAQSGNFEEATGYKELARTLKKHLQSFTSKLEDTREQIERTAKCYQLLDKKKVLKRVPTVPSPGNIIMEEEDQSMDRNHQVWSKSQDPRPISLITASSDSLSSLPEEETENQAPGEDNPPPPPPLPREWTPVPVNTHLTSMPAVSELKLSNAEKSKRTLTHIMREMVQTERDYVLSLQYVIENYIPELQRPDVPQALRGKGSIIFGNIEKIYQFHRQYFLREVERCERNPFQISHYFLMHESQFYLYALYNKNKPKSDMLMAEYGKVFFKDKQAKLGDKMDLGSYLLKPVQRMGKYALLLKQIMKECPPTDQEYQDLRAAEQMVKFQLRHGNDLLAMDSLRDCDVNLQEQGRLLRQDEFIVWQGRRKSLRHVFLFEDLILFSKTRRGRSGGPDSYFYKFSLKMAEVGLTESYGDTGYKFEIWFRKRSKGESYILQAQSSDIRHHWVKEISRVLWNQAITNREKHMSEMATMGIGNKPCLEIKPSANQINDRFINVASGNFQSRTRNSIAVSSFDHMYQNNKRPHSIISISSTSSSSSSHSGAFHPHHLPPDTSRTTNYLSNESGIGTDISSGEDHGIRYDQSERGIAFTRQPAINESNLFSDTISTDNHFAVS